MFPQPGIAFDNPRVGIALAVCRDGEVLLHKRKGKHAPGEWGFIGGHLEKYETFMECLYREAKEEVGEDIEFETPYQVCTLETFYKEEGRHYVVIIFAAKHIRGEAILMEPDKAEKWEWFNWKELPEPLMQGLVIMKNKGINPTSMKG